MLYVPVTATTVVSLCVVFVLLAPGQVCLYCVRTCYSQDSYVCMMFVPVTARAVVSVWCSYLLQPERLCLYGILQEGWARN